MKTRMNIGLLLAAMIASLALPARAAAPTANDQVIEVNFNEQNKQIILGQGADLTFSVAVGAQYGTLKDMNGTDVYPLDPEAPQIIPKNAANQAVLTYGQSGETNHSEPDILVYEVTNSAGESSTGIIQLNVRLNPKIELFYEDPQVNPAATVLGVSISMDENQAINIDSTRIPDDSNSPSDFRTIWARYTDSAGQTAYSSAQYLIDNTPPLLTWVRVPANNATVKGEIEFELQAIDNVGVSQVRFTAPDSAVSVPLTTPSADQNWIKNFDTTVLADGPNPYQFKFEVVDLVNLAGQPKISNLKIDNTAPTIGEPSLPDGSVITALTEITVPVDGGTVEIFVDGSKVNHTLTPPSTYVLVPPVTAPGEHDVTIRVTDGPGNVTEKTIRVTVTGNRAPVAVPDIANTARDQFVDIDVLANDTDMDGDTLTVQSVATPEHGSAGIRPNRVIRYTPTANYTGEDTFTYTISDGKTTAIGFVTVGISAGANRAPTVNNDSATTAEDTTKDINVLANDSDLDGDTLVIYSVGAAEHGTVSINPNKTLRYAPAADYHGGDSFTYTVSDGQGHFVNGTVTMTITPVDDPSRTQINDPLLSTPDISGTIPIVIRPEDDGDIVSVVVKINDGDPIPATPRPDGGYDFILDTTPLPDGPNTITVIVTDDGNNEERKDIIIDVDNTPGITTPTLPTGTTVDGTHVIDVDPTPGTVLDRVEIVINGTPVPPMTDEPFDYLWDTTALPDGPVTVVIRSTDDDGNETVVTRIVNIDNTPDGSTDPEIVIIGGNPEEHIGNDVVTLVLVGDGITDVVFVIDGVPHPATPIPPNRDEYELDTNTLSDGPHTIYATYVKDGVPHDTPIIDYRVDNTRPTATAVKPGTDEVVYGPVVIQIDVNDPGQNPISHVDFYLGNLSNKIALVPGKPNPSETLYDFVFDTRLVLDGIVNIIAIPTDKAGNTGVPAVFRLQINNTTPPPAGNIAPHPANGAFVTSADDSKIYAVFGGEAISTDYLSANASKIFSVYVEKDGAEPVKLEGTASLSDGKLIFSETIPENAKITWSISIRDINNQPYEGSYRFTRAMSRAIGGTVTNVDRRFKLVVPADALPSDMFINIIDESSTQSTGGAGSLANFESVNPGQNIVAGPFMIQATDKDGRVITTIARAASCSYSVPAAQDDLNSPKVFQLAQLFEDGKVFPLGSSGGPRVQSLAAADPVGSRTIDVPITRFGRFVITSQLMPDQGLTHFYNFPNPFNPNRGGTDFHYFLGADSSVTIMIYDLFGREVKSFEIPMGGTGGKLGLNLFTWDGRNGAGEVIANGGYIARVLAEDAQGRRSKASYKIGVLK